jgi:hypothetical protein
MKKANLIDFSRITEAPIRKTHAISFCVNDPVDLVLTSKEKPLRFEFLLPAWVPVEAWKAYEEMRKKIKRPLTKYAKSLAIKRLNTLRKEGHDPGEVLDQSIFNSWQGLFPISDSTSKQEDNRDAIKRAFRKSAH